MTKLNYDGVSIPTFKHALGIAGLVVNEATAEAILRIAEATKVAGESLNIKSITDIVDGINKRYENQEQKIS